MKFVYSKKLFPFLLFIILIFVAPLSMSMEEKPIGGNEYSEFEIHIQNLYNSCQLKLKGLDYQLFRSGVIGYYNILSKDFNTAKKHILSVIDFEKPSTEKRLWIIDLKNQELLYHSLVAHGKNTGEDKPINFSNCENSNMSSIGFYLTDDIYYGKHGLSLIIDGLDENFNSNAKKRSVVIHSADYVSEEFIKCNGRLGRSHGCPAIPVENHKEVINTIKGGSVLYIHFPCSNYSSTYLNIDEAVRQFQSIKN